MPTRDPQTFLAGLIGSGIAASLTPAMHEREAQALGLREVYQIIDLAALGLGVDALPALLDSAQRFGFSGLNITHPCKQAVLPLLDALSPDATALSAVNTVVFENGKRIGHNTDWTGYAEAFRRFLPGADLSRVVQLGAGGAGGAVAYALMSLGCDHLAIHDIDASRAAAVVAQLSARFGAQHVSMAGDLGAAVAAATGLVNTTPIGMAKYPGTPLPVDMLHPGLFVSEIIYFPLETALLAAARKLGCRTLDGGGMAVFQAVEAFRLITGHTPDAERMMRHFAELTSQA